MPIPLLVLLAGGAVAAAARGAAWLAERKVKETNAEVGQAERAAHQKNEEFRAQRTRWKAHFSARLTTAEDEYRAFCAAHRVDEKEVDEWRPETWLQARLGDLTIKRPLLIEPKFDMPAGMQQMNGYRMYQSGLHLARNHPGMGNALQGAGLAVAAGAYVSQQVDSVTEADKYVASAAVYVAALRSTVAGFGARFQSEVESDLRSVERLTRLLDELQTQPLNGPMVKCIGITHRSLVSLLRGLIGRYA